MTNSFSGTTIAQADYELEDAVYEINYESAQARKADKYTALTPDQPRFVVGGMGPTNRTASISPDVNDPGKRLVTFDDLKMLITTKQKAFSMAVLMFSWLRLFLIH